MARGVPAEVVVDHRIETALQVDPLREAIGGHQHRCFGFLRIKGLRLQRRNPFHPLLGRQLTGDRPNHGAALGQGCGELFCQVVGSGAEAAEDHRPVALAQQLLHLPHQLLQLGVFGGAPQPLGGFDQRLQVSAIGLHRQVPAGGGLLF